MANEGEGADPSSDLKRQNSGTTTTADLARQGADQDPAAPNGQEVPASRDTRITGPGEGASDDAGLSHAPSGG